MTPDYIEIKLPKTRKAQNFIVYPWGATDTKLRLQSSNYCIIFDREEKTYLVSKRVANYPMFDHCLPRFGGRYLELPEEITTQLMALEPTGKSVLIMG